MRPTAVIILIILIILFANLKRIYQNHIFDTPLKKQTFDEMAFNTGDIIFFRYRKKPNLQVNNVADVVEHLYFDFAVLSISVPQLYFGHDVFPVNAAVCWEC